MVDKDSVELEAQGQASAQSTTGTVTCGANKKEKKNNKVAWIVGHFENFGNFENCENFKDFLRNLRILRIFENFENFGRFKVS